MKLKNILIVVKDIEKSKQFYHDLFGLDMILDNDGNMILTEGLVLQDEKIWREFLGRDVLPRNHSCELYFEERNIGAFVEKLERLYPDVHYVNRLIAHGWGQKVIRFYDLDGNLIEVGTPANAWTDLQCAKDQLIIGSYTCVICKGDSIYTSSARGVKPLVTWYEEGMGFSGFSAADKVIGRATAFLYVLLGVKTVYADVISRPAMEILEAGNIEVHYDTLVDHIINRKGDGICPFEAAVLQEREAVAAYQLIRKKMDEMGIFL